jgi:hypothetical protein
MTTDRALVAAHPAGEQPLVEIGKARPVVADTFAGRVHMEWEAGEGALVTPLGQLPFFIEYVKQGGLFDGWIAGCPLNLTSPNAPSKRDILGTMMLSVLAGHRRYAHITALRCDPVNPPLLGMSKVVSEDCVWVPTPWSGHTRGRRTPARPINSDLSTCSMATRGKATPIRGQPNKRPAIIGSRRALT